MTKAASVGALQELHRAVAKSLTERLRQDMEDEVPTDAATLGAAIKFLKDNNISADPADKEDLGNLRDELSRQREARKARLREVTQRAEQDLKEATGG